MYRQNGGIYTGNTIMRLLKYVDGYSRDADMFLR